MRRHEISDWQWEVVAPLLSGKAADLWERVVAGLMVESSPTTTAASPSGNRRTGDLSDSGRTVLTQRRLLLKLSVLVYSNDISLS